jgi:alpha-tubulin suppressor-like RCC1 family protein
MTDFYLNNLSSLITTVDNTVRKSLFSMMTFNDNIMVAAGINHSVFLLSDGTVMTCGQNNYGQLGDGTNTDRNSPVYVYTTGTTKLSNVKNVYTGGYHTLFLLNDGTVYVCGRNTDGQLGNGNNTNLNRATLN